MQGKNPDFPLHSVSEINQRAGQLATVAIVLGFFMSVIYFLLGLYYVAFMVATFSFGIGLVLFLNHKNIIKNTKLPLVIFVSVSLIFLQLMKVIVRASICIIFLQLFLYRLL